MGGVYFPEGGQLRIPAGGLKISVSDDGSIISDSVQVELAMDVWPFWLDIALDHANEAVDIRERLRGLVAEAPSAKDRDLQLQNHLLVSEFKAGMVAIAASAFALDNFYAVVSRFTPDFDALRAEWKEAGTARHLRVSETLRRTFRLTNEQMRTVRQTVADLFRFRDWAVHPPAGFREPAWHDLLQSGVEWRFVAFRASNAASAARAAVTTIRGCVRLPRPGNEALVAWCDRQQERAETRFARIQHLPPDEPPTEAT